MKEVAEKDMLEAIKFAHEEIKSIVPFRSSLWMKWAKEKRGFTAMKRRTKSCVKLFISSAMTDVIQ